VIQWIFAHFSGKMTENFMNSWGEMRNRGENSVSEVGRKWPKNNQTTGYDEVSISKIGSGISFASHH